ncbi:general substrate transporter [Stachybotrys elegans]|uniref:General substrate transporter n=1 Tax=Stachybotrys elegans TaxID=80388 RepID=A0A8K0SED4_9HYPO|nr:general substrate transporter [Stachybotrys elegans]
MIGKASDAGLVHEFDEDVPLWQAIRRYPKVVAWDLSLALIIMGWGFDSVVVGSISSVEAFQRDYGEILHDRLIIPSVWLSLWSAATPLGMSFGSLFAGWLQDRFGRRQSLFWGSIIAAVAVALIFCSGLLPDVNGMRLAFTLGKLIQGFASGLLKIVSMTYMSENSPVALRGSALALIPTLNLVGQLIGSTSMYAINDVQGNTGYLAILGMQWLFAVLPFIISLLIPESPTYLLNKDQADVALRSAQALYAPRANAQEALARLRQTIEEEKAESKNCTYLECFHARHRRRTVLVLLANLFPTLFGLDLITRGSYFLQTIGMDSGTSLLLLILGIVLGFAANVGGVWVMARFPRRATMMTSLGAAGVLWAAMGIAGSWLGSQGEENPVVYYFTAADLMIIVVAVGLGAWPGTYAINGETSALRMRSKTQGLGGVSQQVSSVVMSLILPYIYNLDAGALGGRTGFLFAGTCFLSVIWTFYFLPEMKGRPAMDVDMMFDAKLPARHFSAWTASSTQ